MHTRAVQRPASGARDPKYTNSQSALPRVACRHMLAHSSGKPLCKCLSEMSRIIAKHESQVTDRNLHAVSHQQDRAIETLTNGCHCRKLYVMLRATALEDNKPLAAQLDIRSAPSTHRAPDPVTGKRHECARNLAHIWTGPKKQRTVNEPANRGEQIGPCLTRTILMLCGVHSGLTPSAATPGQQRLARRKTNSRRWLARFVRCSAHGNSMGGEPMTILHPVVVSAVSRSQRQDEQHCGNNPVCWLRNKHAAC